MTCQSGLLLEKRMQLAFDRVSKWDASHGFRLSHSKTVVKHFCCLRGIYPNRDLFMYGQQIRYIKENCIFGLRFKSRITWVPLVHSLKVSCYQTLNLLRVLSHTSWGADKAILLRLQNARIRPKLNYE